MAADKTDVPTLGPQLEWDSQQDVNFTVFHELSHVELEHHLLPVDARQRVEDEADAKAREWGAPKRKRGKAPLRASREETAKQLKPVSMRHRPRKGEASLINHRSTRRRDADFSAPTLAAANATSR